MKKTLSLVLSLVMLVAMLPTFAFNVFATTVEGYCGGTDHNGDLKWSIDTAATNPTLIIEYTNESYNLNSAVGMKDYATDEDMPWYTYKDIIKSVRVKAGNRIGNNAFNGFKNLTKVTVADSVKSIGNYAFMYCSSLATVELSNGLTSIEDYAFSDTAINDLSVPNTVTSIAPHAFGGAYYDDLTNRGIPRVYYRGTATGSPWGSYTVYSFTWNINGDTLTISGEGEMENWNDDATPEPFQTPWRSYRKEIKHIVVEEGITVIGNEAFYMMSIAEDITLPSTITKIGSKAFYLCSSVSELFVPCTVTSIGANAFDSVDKVYYSGKATGSPWAADEVVANTTDKGHVIENLEPVNATCFSTGLKAGKRCKVCDYQVPQEEIPMLEHKWDAGTVTTAATCGKAGVKTYKCTTFGCKVTKTVAIPATNKHIYKAKLTKKPTSKATGVLTYTCSVCGKKYTKSIAKIAIAKISSVASKKKAQLTVNWAKKTCTGYQIQVATDSKFKKNVKNATVTKAKTVTKTMTKLKAGKKYYVRVRCYKTVKGTKCYGSWTKAKTVTVKK